MLHLSPPWLSLDLGQDMPVLSWAPHKGGLTRARRILWREVRNADLTEALDVTDWLRRELGAISATDAVCFLTSRKLSAAIMREHTEGGITAKAVVTAGLSNAERIGTRLPQTWKDWGTINIAVTLSTPLTLPARIEALSLVAEARTTAVIDAQVTLPSGTATGTGTDCIAVAAPDAAQTHVAPDAAQAHAERDSANPTAYAGKHTDAGHAIGRAVYDATRAAVQDWLRDAARW
ncbi:adenosylcobinamide amidohydrolase [Salipiger sp. P9]|uniref:adenosylcobinamide amidohydrolase n=1 Tax=Salipiger pentaromativorans TaxID=2943193 RepID=UPI002157684B|nr:adenosylcobinamide amidohydrolase [Salipiger pentaromativorans]MCR8547371.1 adenosylcobinamide amidohydrolase [Salipiger pentaromativorans]